MSQQRVKKIQNVIKGATTSWATNVLTVTTGTAHGLTSGQVVSLMSPDSPQALASVTITVTSTTAFTVSASAQYAGWTACEIVFGFFTAATTTSFTLPVMSGAGAIIQGVVSGTGAVSAAITFNVSLDGQNWVPLSTMSLTGTTSATDGFVVNAHWVYMQAVITAVTGTGAGLTLMIGG